MATPLKNWFAVADSMLREELTQRGRSTFLGLLAWFNQRRARDGVRGKRACEASIPPGDMLTVTLEETLERAREALAEIAPRFELKIESRNAFTFVYWPNVAKWLEAGSPKRGQTSGKTRVSAARALPPPIRSDPIRPDIQTQHAKTSVIRKPDRKRSKTRTPPDQAPPAKSKGADGVVVLERMRHAAGFTAEYLGLPPLDCRWTLPRQKLITAAHRDFPEHGHELGVEILRGFRELALEWSREARLAAWSVEALFAPANVGKRLQARPRPVPNVRPALEQQPTVAAFDFGKPIGAQA